jgi:hypothetical protein
MSLAVGIVFLAWQARSFVVATDLATVAAVACKKSSLPTPQIGVLVVKPNVAGQGITASDRN